MSFLWEDEPSDAEADEKAAERHYHKMRGHIADALTLGESLKKCQGKKVLMVSPSVRRVRGANLLSRYWEVWDVKPLRAHDSWLTRCESRFRGTFNKLRAIEMTMFRKVIVKDLGNDKLTTQSLALVNPTEPPYRPIA